MCSLWGRRGDRFYCSINSYNMGEGRMIRVWFFHSCIPRPSLVICSFVLGSPHHRQYDLNNSNLFPTILETKSSRSRCLQDWFLLRPLSFTCRQLALSLRPHMASSLCRCTAGVSSSSYKDIRPIGLGPHSSNFI